jgi:hypothetical protein
MLSSIIRGLMTGAIDGYRDRAIADRAARQVIQALDSREAARELIELAGWIPGLRDYVSCPVCRYGGQVWAVMVDLTDRHRWSWQRVTAWLETLNVDLQAKGLQR